MDLALGLVAVGDEAEVLVGSEVDRVPHREPEDVVRRRHAPADVHVPAEELLVEALEGLRRRPLRAALHLGDEGARRRRRPPRLPDPHQRVAAAGQRLHLHPRVPKLRRHHTVHAPAARSMQGAGAAPVGVEPHVGVEVGVEVPSKCEARIVRARGVLEEAADPRLPRQLVERLPCEPHACEDAGDRHGGEAERVEVSDVLLELAPQVPPLPDLGQAALGDHVRPFELQQLQLVADRQPHHVVGVQPLHQLLRP
mmetsp:Transcript_30290/g.87329  ORF Transcript_30290/g.87329 Transcript_30290/m.87329 type:complete len:254 (-) Transcript_30290:347-1108(-)